MSKQSHILTLFIFMVTTGRTLHFEALESTLAALSSYQEQDPSMMVCVVCLGVWAEGTCTCESPAWWPISHVIRRLELQLGYNQ